MKTCGGKVHFGKWKLTEEKVMYLRQELLSGLSRKTSYKKNNQVEFTIVKNSQRPKVSGITEEINDIKCWIYILKKYISEELSSFLEHTLLKI